MNRASYTYLFIALTGAFLCSSPIPTWPMAISFTTFGSCAVAANCSQTIDNHFTGPGNTDSINFSITSGEVGPGVWTASGTVIETLVRDASGNAVGVGFTLTNTTVQATVPNFQAPPKVLGEIDIISSLPIHIFGDAGGFVFLNGQYQSFTGRAITAADLSGIAFIDGARLATATAPTVTATPSPVAFTVFGSGRTFVCTVLPPPCGFTNLAFGILDFGLAAGDGFVLPTSADFSVTAVPEPASFLLLGSGLAGFAAWRRRVQHGSKQDALK